MGRFDAVTLADVEEAIADLDRGIQHPFGPSTKFDLAKNGRRYPPKAVLGLAARRTVGQVTPDEFSSGEGSSQAVSILRALGCTIVVKSEDFRQLSDVGGYALVSDPEWLDFHIANSVGSNIVYSRGAGAPMQNVPPGGIVFCMRRGETPRAIHLWGNFRQAVQYSPSQAWDLFGTRLGSPDRASYLNSLATIGSILEQDSLTAIELENIVVPPIPIPIALAGVDVPLTAVKGRSISESEVQRILIAAGVVHPGPGNPSSNQTFLEGSLKLCLHYVKERKQAVVRAAKAHRRKIDPLLRCDACTMSFLEAYGPGGEGYIEAHHKVPLSELDGETETTIEHLALVCSNCHSMLHRISLTVEELRALIAQRKNTSV